MDNVLTETSISDLVVAISSLLDWSQGSMRDHNKRVTYIAHELALEMGLSPEEVQLVALASLIHDVGILYNGEQVCALKPGASDEVQHHTLYAYEILKGVPSMEAVAEAILHHHTRFDSPEHQHATLYSDIIHLADRVDALSKKDTSILSQSAEITLAIGEKMGTEYHPSVVLAFLNLAEKEAFWLSATKPQRRSYFLDMNYGRDLSEEGKIQFLQSVCHLVDFRSSYTATHSTGVTTVATLLGQKCGMESSDIKALFIAGLLHDMGKLSISSDILEKAGALSDDEFHVVKAHAFLTHVALDHINGFATIERYASCHHENVNGTGYPYRHQGDALSLGCQMMRIADVYTAITEDRPYRSGGQPSEAVEKLFAMARHGDIDPQLVETLETHLQEIDTARKSAQQEVLSKYQAFTSLVSKFIVA